MFKSLNPKKMFGLPKLIALLISDKTPLKTNNKKLSTKTINNTIMKKSFYFLAALISLMIIGCETEEVQPEIKVEYETDTVIVNQTDTVFITVVEVDSSANIYGNLSNLDESFATNTLYDYKTETMTPGDYSVRLTPHDVRLTINDTLYIFNVDIILYSENQGLVKGSIWNDGNTVSGDFMLVTGQMFNFDFNTENGNIYGYLLNN